MDEENDNDIETPVEEGVEVLETLCEQEQGKEEAASPIPVPEPKPKPDKPQADAREHQRYLVNWRAAIIHGGAEEKSTLLRQSARHFRRRGQLLQRLQHPFHGNGDSAAGSAAA